MRKTRCVGAMAQALAEEMERDGTVCLLAGDDLHADLGPECLGELARRFGANRVRDMAGVEEAILGVAAGAAACGLRPVAGMSGSTLLGLAMDGLVGPPNAAACLSEAWPGLTVLLTLGSGPGWNGRLARCLETWLLNLPGVVVAVPAGPTDTRELLRAAIRKSGPAVVLAHEGLGDLAVPAGEPDGGLPLGRAAVRRQGQDVTVVAASRLVATALDAAARLDGEGTSVEVVDLRCLVPLDMETILASVKKTHALVLPQESHGLAGANAEIAVRVAAGALDFLDTPIVRPVVPRGAGPDEAPDAGALAAVIRAIH